MINDLMKSVAHFVSSSEVYSTYMWESLSRRSYQNVALQVFHTHLNISIIEDLLKSVG